MTFGTGCPSEMFEQFFYGSFRERGFRQLAFLKGENPTLSNMVILYFIRMQILYWFEPMPENSYLRRIHGIIDSIRKSYLFAQAKKQNYGIFWKTGVLWEF